MSSLWQTPDRRNTPVVARVGYELDSIYSNPAALDESLVRRSRDNLSVAVDLTRMPRQMTHPSGDGAAHLLDDLIDDFIPCVEQHFDVAPGPNALMGHSGGGYFSLYAALARPAVFNRIAAGHPVLFSYGLFGSLAASWARSSHAPRPRLFVGTGQLEPSEFVDDIHRFMDHLRATAPSGAHITSRVFDDETHSSGWRAIYTRGLRTVLGNFRPGETTATPTVTCVTRDT